MSSNPSDRPLSSGTARDSVDTLSPDAASKPVALQLAIVSYDARPDRGTIHPPGLEGIARMETWLSADMDVFVELDAYR